MDLQLAGHLPRVGEVGERAVAEVVDDVDRVALGQQPLGEVRADEPGPTHHERPSRRVGVGAAFAVHVLAGRDDAIGTEHAVAHLGAARRPDP